MNQPLISEYEPYSTIINLPFPTILNHHPPSLTINHHFFNHHQPFILTFNHHPTIIHPSSTIISSTIIIHPSSTISSSTIHHPSLTTSSSSIINPPFIHHWPTSHGTAAVQLSWRFKRARRRRALPPSRRAAATRAPLRGGVEPARRVPWSS